MKRTPMTRGRGNPVPPKVKVLRLSRLQILERITREAIKHVQRCDDGSPLVAAVMLVHLLKDDDPVKA